MTSKDNIYTKLKADNPEKFGENFGKFWSKEEDAKLLSLIEEDATIEEIANEHKRTTGSITSRLRVIVKRLHNDGKTNDEIKHMLKFLSDDEIEKAINYEKKKKQPIEKQILYMHDEKTYDSIIQLHSVMTDVKNLLQQLVDMKEKQPTTDNIEWSLKVLNKMVSIKDDKQKLKEYRLKLGISKDLFYDKLKSLTKN